MITRNSLQEMIENYQDKGKIIGRALLVVFHNQTNDEQNQNTTAFIIIKVSLLLMLILVAFMPNIF